MPVLKGIVRSGRGAALHDPSGLFDLIRDRAGLPDLRRGTLNVVLEQPFQLQPDFVLSAQEIRLQSGIPSDWSRDYSFQRCELNGVSGLIMRPMPSVHDDRVLEVMACVHLRDELGIGDDTVVEIEV